MIDLAGARAYDLTNLTGRPVANERVTAVKSFDVNRRLLVSALAGAGAGLPLAGLLALLLRILGAFAPLPNLSTYLVLVPLATAAAGAYLFGSRDSEGLFRHQHVAAALNSRKIVGGFFIGDLRVDPDRREEGWIVSNTIPGPGATPDGEPVEALLFDHPRGGGRRG